MSEIIKYYDKPITSLRGHEVFVFGSNLCGYHGKGAAKLAKEKFKAIQGVGEGIQGKAYGIPTKPCDIRNVLELSRIFENIRRFLIYSSHYQSKTFLVTNVACGNAHYHPITIAPLFQGGIGRSNIVFSREFAEILATFTSSEQLSYYSLLS